MSMVEGEDMGEAEAEATAMYAAVSAIRYYCAIQG
jgi:hypothetical protein